MRISDPQWEILESFFPKKVTRRQVGGRPRYPDRELLQGVLWVMRTGARWKDLPRGYPSGSTCHKHFSEWVAAGIFDKIIRALIVDLQKRGKINLVETFIDAMFVEAKKGAKKSAKPSLVRVAKSWQSSTVDLFLSPCLLKVLHHMRIDLLCQRFGPAILGTYLTDLSETKLTILIHLGKISDDMAANSLLPSVAIESDQLKMADLYDATDEDGWSNDSLLGSSSFGA